MAFFPKDFIWGAASSSYQIEGAVREDGRGESIWDVYSHTPGKICHGDTGDLAADAYHRWREDVSVMKDMGLGAYRFSLAWPRIAPMGDENWNKDGFRFYDALVDALLEAGIEPWITLYHWDLPQALQARGGWESIAAAESFAAYAAHVGRHFKGRVRHYFTINEPQCAIGLGYGGGEHAPGLKLPEDRLALCWKHILLAHALASDALHEIDAAHMVGIASTGNIFYPERECADDIEAARQLTFAVPEGAYSFAHSFALDPLCLGQWPEPLRPEISLPLQKPDFIGLNIYHGTAARMTPDGPAPVPFDVGAPRTAMDWPVTPSSLEWGARFMSQRYSLPLYISENGLSCRDWVQLDGKVHDSERIDFLTRYLRALSSAVNAGADVRGYFHWSLTDNFEWAEGYRQRFGLIYIDYATMKRIPKDSALWYAEVIRHNGGNL